MSPSSPNPSSHRSSTSSTEFSPAFTRSNTAGSTSSNFTPSFFYRIRAGRSRSISPVQRTNSSPLPSPTEDFRPQRLHLRTDSSSSNGLTTPSPRARSRSTKRNSGTYMQVGRHGNDWLFGGFSFTEAVKGLLSPCSTDGDHRD